MAEQVEKMPQEQKAEATGEEFLVVSDVPEAEEEAYTQNKDEKDSLLVPEAELMTALNASEEHEPVKAEDKAPLALLPSDEEDATKISHLPENENKALQELKHLVQKALHNHEFGISASLPPKQAAKIPVSTATEQQPAKVDSGTAQDSIPAAETIAKTLLEDDGAKTLEAIEETIVACVHSSEEEETAGTCAKAPEQVFIWGVKLLEDERTDVILLKFLRARDFKVKDAFTMIKNTVKWRKEFGIDELVEEDLGSELGRVVFMHGCSKQGNPVCYNVYGEFQNKELYQKTFSDEEKRQKFLKWRIQFLEKSIRKLDFRPGGVSTIVQVNDLKNSPGPNRWELRQATNQALQLLQDNYPEFVAKQIFINVPWWYLALSKMISPFLTQRTKSKFVVAGPSRSTETLFKYICAEQIPTQYGGLSKDGDFGTADSVTEIIVRPLAKHIVEFPVTQGSIVSWEARVVGWEVRYGAEFVPSAEEGYTIILQKMRRIGPNEEQVMCSSYRVGEPGKLVLTVDNPTSKKKKLLYRFKTKLSN